MLIPISPVANLCCNRGAAGVARSTQGALAAKAATQTIPIVFMQAADPVRIGLVDSLNRPGGNVTGINLMWAELAGKRCRAANDLYQLAIYALSKNTGIPRATILYPTMTTDAVDQVVLLNDPIFGHKRAEITLRPVNLVKLEKLVRPRQGPIVARHRRQFARTLVFGSKPEAQFALLGNPAS